MFILSKPACRISRLFRTAGTLGILLLCVGTASAAVTLKTDLKNGDKVSDVAKIVAHADSPDGIDKVEFKVDEEEPFVGTSVPYEFSWDTIKTTEGPHTLAVTAYAGSGQSKRITLSLIVDNELNLGAAALAQKGEDALAAKDTQTALNYSRRSLKAEPDNLPAERLIAGIYAGRQEWAKAIDALSKAKNLDENPDAMLELASYRMHRALLPENAANFFTEWQEIGSLRRKAADIAVQETIKRSAPADGKATLESSLAIGDAQLRAGHFADAITEYGKLGRADDAPVSLVNRLALAYALNNQPKDAVGLLRPLIIGKKAEAGTRAVLGLAQLRLRQFVEARASVQPDLSDSYPAALVVAAYADTMLAHPKEAATEAKEAVRLAPTAGDAQYALSMASLDPTESERALYRAMALSPFENGPYLDYAVRGLMQNRADRYDQALNITDVVLKNEPNNVSARLMQALIYLQTKRVPDAASLLDALLREDKDSPDLQMAAAAYWNIKQNAEQTQRFMNTAGKSDPTRFNQNQPPEPLPLLFLLTRKWHYRADPFLTLATLVPSGTAAP